VDAPRRIGRSQPSWNSRRGAPGPATPSWPTTTCGRCRPGLALARAPAALRAVEYAGLAGRDALGALAYEEAAAHFGRAIEALSRAAEVPPPSRCELLLGLAEALLNSGAIDRAEPHLGEALRLARQSGAARQLATAARLVACSRRSTLAVLDGDLPLAARQARLAWDIGTRASLPDAGAVLWGSCSPSGWKPSSPTPTKT